MCQPARDRTYRELAYHDAYLAGMGTNCYSCRVRWYLDDARPPMINSMNDPLRVRCRLQDEHSRGLPTRQPTRSVCSTPASLRSSSLGSL